MFNLDHYELHSLYVLFMLISIKKSHPFFPFIKFPLKEVAILHDFARDFVIGFFEIESANNARLEWGEASESGKVFFTRMYNELVGTIGQEMTNAILAWNQTWSFYGIYTDELAIIWYDIILPLKERKIVQELDKSFLKSLDLIVEGYSNRTDPFMDAFDGIDKASGDNWDYMVHYLYNRGELRDGTKVDAFEMSPWDHFEGLVDAVGQYLALRELKTVLSPDVLASINNWLREQPFWQEWWSAYPNFETLLERLTESSSSDKKFT